MDLSFSPALACLQLFHLFTSSSHYLHLSLGAQRTFQSPTGTLRCPPLWVPFMLPSLLLCCPWIWIFCCYVPYSTEVTSRTQGGMSRVMCDWGFIVDRPFRILTSPSCPGLLNLLLSPPPSMPFGSHFTHWPFLF